MSAQRPPICSQTGFTLVEVVLVVVILGVVASIGSGFLVYTVKAYREGQEHANLVLRARVALEQMTRELRMAAPNSVRVSTTGNCIEFLPVVGAARYQQPVADSENGQAATNVIATADFQLQTAATQVLIAPLTAGEVYTASTPAARVGSGGLAAGAHSSVPLAGAHQFMRNYGSLRLYLTRDPVRFCLVGSEFYRFSDYGFSTLPLSDGDPGGNSALFAEGVSTDGQVFAVSPGSEDRNATVVMDFGVDVGGKRLRLKHEVFVRNVP